MTNRNINLLAIYEVEGGITYPSAMIMVVQEESFNICDSEYYLNLMIQQELGLECEFNIVPIDIDEDDIRLYATPKLIQQTFDVKHNFADHLKVWVDEDYLFNLETSFN